jgi:hypothetical protein
MSTFRFALGLVLGIAIPFALQRWDRARLPPERRACAWNTASWAAALYAFGPLSMLGWVWVTRQRFREWHERDDLVLAVLKSVGLELAGALAAAAIVLAIALVDWGIGALVGEP